MLIHANRFLITRRLVQITVMLLFFAGSAAGWTILRGNLSCARLFDVLTLADPYAVLQMLAARAMPTAEIAVGALTVAVIYALLGGRVFCAWVCPMNVVTDLAAWLRRRLGIAADFRLSRTTRYWVMALALALSAVLGVAAFEWISPVGVLHRGLIYGFGAGWLVVLAVFVFDLLVARGGFCGHLCPMGAFYSLIGRGNLIKPVHNPDKCTMCMRCVEVCPERQVLHMIGKKNAMVSSGQCINCGRCIEVCGDNAIGLGSRLFSDK
ncbi:MAG: quinol dehydrogenase ferredoxin subunit NapH [Candidatus Magnetobacterium sp. LHC-1]|nr:quinol dehydrogenase ferredoxin subunit NapH [Nitrospirota bacterium]